MREFRPIYRHWRVPTLFTVSNKGMPCSHLLLRYSRKLGFITKSMDKSLDFILQLGYLPHPRGGATECQFIDNAGTVIATGRTVCSMSDNFSYHVGRRIAFERAMYGLTNWYKRRELEEEIQVHGHC